MTALGRPPALLDIVEEHFDELDWLLEHREANLFTSDWTLADLAEHEQRAEAHLHGLRLAELHGIDLAQNRIGGSETFAAAAATHLLFSAPEPGYRSLVWETFASAEPEAVDGVRIALRHLPIHDSRDRLEELSRHNDPFRAAAAVDVLAFHRIPVQASEQMKTAADPKVQALALSAAGRLGQTSRSDLERALDSENGSIRWAGLTAAARTGVGEILDCCRTRASEGSIGAPEAIAAIGMLGTRDDVPMLRALLAHDTLAPYAVSALGTAGFVEVVPDLLDIMADEDLGVAATFAYRRITGATDVEGEKPFPPPEVEEGEDEMEALPPDPARARSDWQRRESAMSPQVRWHWGTPFPDDRPPDFSALPLDARRDVYLRLRSRFGERLGDVELEALTGRQIREYGALAGAGG